ncbi:MAG TPA: HAMP domain-containing sensor histidine kinase [Ktedonobacteraceae bacterium]|nr:HAMP domain-containing sensor histidine kinase [Ktedonobacteraceae bacterium]
MEEGRFHGLARQVCDLPECSTALLLLGCQDSALRHPLLDLHSITDYRLIATHNAADAASVLRQERVRGLCDIAVQTGRVQHSSAIHFQYGAFCVRSLAIAPFELPAGVLGFCILLDTRLDAFFQGELLLLQCFLPIIARQLEHDMYRLDAPLDEQREERFGGRNELSSGKKEIRGLEQRITAYIQKSAQPSGQLATVQNGQEEAERINSKFLSMVMHELRTPLTAIKGYAGLLLAYRIAEPLAEPEREALGTVGMSDTIEMTAARQQRYLTTIMEQVTHLEVLVGDLLDISRIHAGRLVLRCAPVDLTLLCRRVVELVQQRVNQQPTSLVPPCEIRFLPAAGLPLVWADPDRVQQVLTNLLDNAVKYSPGGGRIEVWVSLCGPHGGCESYNVALPAQQETLVQVTVRDHGIGIPRGQQMHLFKPFRRLEHPLTYDVTGAGLGLYIARKLITAMDGQVSLESGEGEGTSITFTLPVDKVTGRLAGKADRQVGSGISVLEGEVVGAMPCARPRS